jgi:hypothetical protein
MTAPKQPRRWSWWLDRARYYILQVIAVSLIILAGWQGTIFSGGPHYREATVIGILTKIITSLLAFTVARQFQDHDREKDDA